MAKTHKAFSLIQIMLIIFIVIIIVAIGILIFFKSKENAKQARLRAALTQTQALIDQYYQTTGTYRGLFCSPACGTSYGTLTDIYNQCLPCDQWATATNLSSKPSLPANLTTNHVLDIRRQIGVIAADVKTQLNRTHSFSWKDASGKTVTASQAAGLQIRYNNKFGQYDLGSYAAMIFAPDLAKVDKSVTDTAQAYNQASWLCLDTVNKAIKQYIGWNPADVSDTAKVAATSASVQWEKNEAVCN